MEAEQLQSSMLNSKSTSRSSSKRARTKPASAKACKSRKTKAGAAAKRCSNNNSKSKGRGRERTAKQPIAARAAAGSEASTDARLRRIGQGLGLVELLLNSCAGIAGPSGIPGHQPQDPHV